MKFVYTPEQKRQISRNDVGKIRQYVLVQREACKLYGEEPIPEYTYIDWLLREIDYLNEELSSTHRST